MADVHLRRPGPAGRRGTLTGGVIGVLAALVVLILLAVALALLPDRGTGTTEPLDQPTPTPGMDGGGTDRGRPGPPPQSAPGFPDETTTGVPDGVFLRASGPVRVTEDGAVVEGLFIVDGGIEVYADDVTIRHVRITNRNAFVQWGIHQDEGASGLVVEDSEIFGDVTSPHQFATGIANHGGMITVRRVEIHSVTDGIVTSHGLIEDNYLHSPRYFEGDHTDMIQANGGPQDGLTLVIRHNTVVNTLDQTGAVSLFDNFRPVRDVLVERNLLAGGGYTIYGGGLTAQGATPRNIVIRDNVFSRRVWPEGGYWGPSAYFDVDAPGNLWQGNVWEDGTEVVLPPQD